MPSQGQQLSEQKARYGRVNTAGCTWKRVSDMLYCTARATSKQSASAGCPSCGHEKLQGLQRAVCTLLRFSHACTPAGHDCQASLSFSPKKLGIPHLDLTFAASNLPVLLLCLLTHAAQLL